jgi:hypothetical protein
MRCLTAIIPLGLLAGAVCHAVYAQAETTGSAFMELKNTEDAESQWQMEIRQVPLAQVLDYIHKQTQIPIHYSVLPEGLVTATCVGESLQKILACVLNHKADIIVRHQHQKQGGQGAQIAEAWILGSKLDGHPVTRSDCVAVIQPKDTAPTGDKYQKAEEEQFQTLLKMAKSAKPEERAEAMGNLLAVGRSGDAEIKETLEKGLTDKDASVRAQAISTYTHRDDLKENAHDIISDAMQDDSVDVRMMAVDGIGNDADLLQQAINDPDESISGLAKLKLEELMARQKPK